MRNNSNDRTVEQNSIRLIDSTIPWRAYALILALLLILAACGGDSGAEPDAEPEAPRSEATDSLVDATPEATEKAEATVEGPLPPASTPTVPPPPTVEGPLPPASTPTVEGPLPPASTPTTTNADDCPTQEEKEYILFVVGALDSVDWILSRMLEHLEPLIGGGPASDEALGQAWFQEGAEVNEGFVSVAPDVVRDITPPSSPAAEEIHIELAKLQNHFLNVSALHWTVVQEGFNERARTQDFNNLMREVQELEEALAVLWDPGYGFCG